MLRLVAAQGLEFATATNATNLRSWVGRVHPGT